VNGGLSSRSRRAALPLAAAFALAAVLLALAVGPSGVGPAEVVEALGGTASPAVAEVVLEVRLPRVLLGLLVGAALALAGAILQALLRNDLAEPYLLGVGPGAFLGVTVAALVAGSLPGALARGGAALLGAVLVSALVFTLARRAGRDAGPTLLLGGVAVGAWVSALATAALYVAVADWHRVVAWLLGHLGPRPGEDLAFLAVVLLVSFLLAFVRARDLDAVALGEEGAWLLGVDPRRLVRLLGLAACALAAAAVSVSGLIGFVGLLVPHLARGWVGPAHRRLLPVSLLLGAGLLVLADALARTLHPPLDLPVGVVTAALGAPVLAAIVLRSR
jgi:iron complex transport system permease protein